MSALRVTAARTIGRARNRFLTAFAIGAFLAASALLFAFRLEAAEGGVLPLSVVWASSVSAVLPALVALLAMDVWCEERQTGRIDMLLTLAVRERDFVIGKFFGVLSLSVFAIFLSVLLSVTSLVFLAPQTLEGVGICALLLAFAAVFTQAILWCAIDVALSALFRHMATVACAAFVLTMALPRCVWFGLQAWAPAGRTAFGEFPLDAHVIDIASGIIPLGIVAIYGISVVVALFLASKCVSAYRLSGKGQLALRFSTSLTAFLSFIVVALAIPLFQKVNPTVDLPVVGTSASLSPRTRGILTESSGDVTITCFLPRGDSRFRSVARVLRQLKRESEALGGARILIRFVDPRWDIGAADRLVRRGVREECVVFEKGRRMTTVPISEDGCGERLCASAIRSISVSTQRRSVYWTVGHGESSFVNYDAFGMSDIARDLSREGFRNQEIDLAAAQQIPGDCALILIAGAKDDFSRVETGRLDAYLREGGRLLVLLGAPVSGGIASMLPSWGVRPLDVPIKDAKTLSGTDVLSSDFAEHPIAVPMKGSRIVLERPISFAPSAAAGTGSGVDSIGFHAVAKVGEAIVVATAERGVGAGQDIALRPTRIVLVGDPGFALNGSLATRASANRDFFSNCVAYLSGIEPHGFGDEGSARLRSGMDRGGRFRHAIGSALVLPLVVFLVLSAMTFRRKRRP